jgi:hypothetical protein
VTTIKSVALAVMLGLSSPAGTQDVRTPYPRMAPLDRYLMADRAEEIALARSAAPDSISHAAEVLVLGPHGFEPAVKGTNGFVCMVQRSWSAGIDDVDFWNPKLRSPICFNPPAARSYLPLTIKRTELVLAGRSKEQMFVALGAAVERKDVPPLESNAMCYMMSKRGYLSDRDGHWRPHLMIFTPLVEPAAWGADLPGSPILAFTETRSRVSVFLVPVGHWSDGSPAPEDQHPRP